MIKCVRFIIAVCLIGLLQINQTYAEIPVIDDSDNYTMMEEAQAALEDVESNSRFDMYNADTESALVTETIQNNISDDSVILLDKLQVLQQEMQELRGQMEMQAHDLNLLQQQQLAFYKDVTKEVKISDQNNNPKIASAITPTIIDQQIDEDKLNKTQLIKTEDNIPPPAPPVKHNNPAEEQISYLAAYELIKAKQYDKALVALENFTTLHSQSGYAANAHYWMGEVYMIKKNYPAAIKKFETIVQYYPSSSKSAPSLLKIGYALAASNRKMEAKQRLMQVVKNYPDTPTAQLASIKLDTLNHQ